jgi:hypothetical protein
VTSQSTPLDETSPFLNELKSILSDQALSDTEKYDEVCSLVDDWRDMQEPKPATVGWDYTISPNTTTTSIDADLYSKIREAYYAENDITEASFDTMSISAQTTHRKKISAAYSEAAKENAREAVVEKFKNGPFGRIQVADEEINVDAQYDWYHEQITDISYELSLLDNELTSLGKQNDMVNASSSTKTLNERRIRELELEKKPLEAKLTNYKTKISARE